ncbi:class I SAM-dependent methyltransferase [Bradyrhizobium sp. HKCCYLS20291]|uniref:class I SAM-dependent methyltransferase n=1 Tax=Bradyrhizobium sp. HKCCYLS20291 TaxID=3420766 RepID=UPI003EC09088
MTDLFAGTADHYRRFRPPYPQDVFDWIVTQHRLDGTGRLLDCGCGTGHVFVGLAKRFSQTVAMDPDAEMLAAAKTTAAVERIASITFMPGRAETIPDAIGPLRLAAFGASFHWTDRIAVARRLDRLIEPDGAIVILSPGSFWSGREFEWKGVVLDTIKRWLGHERRAGAGTYSARPLHQECLEQTPFRALTEATFVQSYVWTTDSLIGYLYSTSFASRAILGDNAANFEMDLRARLSRLSANGLFDDEIEHSLISARRA